jgi:hypothetical protein
MGGNSVWADQPRAYLVDKNLLPEHPNPENIQRPWEWIHTEPSPGCLPETHSRHTQTRNPLKPVATITRKYPVPCKVLESDWAGRRAIETGQLLIGRLLTMIRDDEEHMHGNLVRIRKCRDA